MKANYQIGMIILLHCLAHLSSSRMILGQENDTLLLQHSEFITDQLEYIALQTNSRIDYSNLVEDYLHYARHPINLNGNEINKLVELYLLNDIQANNIRSYISQYGQLLTVYELKNIPGFDNQTYQNMLPFVTVSKTKQKEKVTPRKMIRNSRQRLILRYSQVLEPSAGYRIPLDSAIHQPGRACLGRPQAYYSRYAFSYKDKIRLGFTLEKDAGELMLKNGLNDSLQLLLGNNINPIFDFWSAHLYISNMGILEKAVIGDYHLEFGQGLTLWSGLSFGKSVSGIQVKKYGNGIRPNSSANENRFFRGGAFTLGWKHFSLTGFYSQNLVDASIQHSSHIDEEWISSMQETGKHRTINEILTRKTLTINAFGGRINFDHRNFQVGTTIYKTILGTQILPGNAPYKYFDLQGKDLLNYGVDYNITLGKIHLFGELSGSQPGGIAGLAGLNAFFTERFIFTVLYRFYEENYHNLFNNPFAETGSPSNESGLYMGCSILLSKNLSLNGYLDHFQFSWLRYRVDGLSSGRDYQLQLNYALPNSTSMYVRFRHRKKQQNESESNSYTNHISTVHRNEFRYFISFQLTESLILKNRLDYVFYQNDSGLKESGYLAYQDILFRPRTFPLEVTFRYALFSTDGYNSRIYSYENDVLYAFSVPSYSGNGQRVYLMLRYKATKQLDIWLRLARMTYTDRKSIGSGCDEIEGNRKTDVKVQMLLKF